MFRWIEHTAELELEIEAPSREAVFGDALDAYAELVGDGGGAPATREIAVEAEEPALLLVEWLGELIYLGEAEGFVPERTVSLRVADGRLEASVAGHLGQPSQLVKAVTLHRLELREEEGGGWRARAVLDV